MSIVYQHNFVTSDDGELIALRYIESMKAPMEGQDLLVDALADDSHLQIITSSGRLYNISMKKQQAVTSYYQSYKKEALRDAIFQRWQHLVG